MTAVLIIDGSNFGRLPNDPGSNLPDVAEAAPAAPIASTFDFFIAPFDSLTLFSASVII